ncbi:hypothetical protein GI584_20030 [Gracilibacillus salitolerans]|uniref:Uncharacterized protein n=1 Tax=Gracilibacillus salitolerans TaxID=2663022 RepID=A0A5Q2TQ71_9BACI|nr:hypothetical protein [Gracilibacillus salitolerans]QGH36193.1 hypothetical protein GI584_20030 [Gracilibacillus salitolerans]
MPLFVKGHDPPRWDVWDSPELREDNEYFQFFDEDIFDTLLEVRDEIDSVNMTDQIPDIDNQLNTDVFVNVLKNQSQTPEEALKQAKEAVENH